MKYIYILYQIRAGFIKCKKTHPNSYLISSIAIHSSPAKSQQCVTQQRRFSGKGFNRLDSQYTLKIKHMPDSELWKLWKPTKLCCVTLARNLTQWLVQIHTK